MLPYPPVAVDGQFFHNGRNVLTANDNFQQNKRMAYTTSSKPCLINVTTHPHPHSPATHHKYAGAIITTGHPLVAAAIRQKQHRN